MKLVTSSFHIFIRAAFVAVMVAAFMVPITKAAACGGGQDCLPPGYVAPVIQTSSQSSGCVTGSQDCLPPGYVAPTTQWSTGWSTVCAPSASRDCAPGNMANQNINQALDAVRKSLESIKSSTNPVDIGARDASEEQQEQGVSDRSALSANDRARLQAQITMLVQIVADLQLKLDASRDISP